MPSSENRTKQLKNMLNDGLISKEEYNDLKRKMRSKENIQPNTSDFQPQNTNYNQTQSVRNIQPQNNSNKRQRPVKQRYILRYIISFVGVLIFFGIYLPSSPFSFFKLK